MHTINKFLILLFCLSLCYIQHTLYGLSMMLITGALLHCIIFIQSPHVNSYLSKVYKTQTDHFLLLDWHCASYHYYVLKNKNKFGDSKIIKIMLLVRVLPINYNLKSVLLMLVLRPQRQPHSSIILVLRSQRQPHSSTILVLRSQRQFHISKMCKRGSSTYNQMQ